MWCLDALLSVEAMVSEGVCHEAATTLGELGSHHHGQRGGQNGVILFVKTHASSPQQARCMVTFKSPPRTLLWSTPYSLHLIRTEI